MFAMVSPWIIHGHFTRVYKRERPALTVYKLANGQVCVLHSAVHWTSTARRCNTPSRTREETNALTGTSPSWLRKHSLMELESRDCMCSGATHLELECIFLRRSDRSTSFAACTTSRLRRTSTTSADIELRSCPMCSQENVPDVPLAALDSA